MLCFHLIADGITLVGRTVMCLKGCETSAPPACFTNSAGEKDSPWQTHKILTSKLEYLYKKPVMVFPFGPTPVVETQGICWRLGMLRVWIWGFGGFPFSIFLFLSDIGGDDFRELETGLVDGSTTSSSLFDAMGSFLIVVLTPLLETWDWTDFSGHCVLLSTQGSGLTRSEEGLSFLGSFGFGWVIWCPSDEELLELRRV